MVNENAGKLFADSLGEKSGNNRGVYAAGKTENDLFVADLLFERSNGIFNKVVHDPVALAAADFVKEVMEHLLAELRVGDLGVELHGIDFSAGVFHSGARTVVRLADHLEALGRLGDVVGVTHPYNALFVDVFEKRAVRSGFQLNFAVFADGSGFNRSVFHPGDQLTAVADTENGNAELEYFRCVMRRLLVIDAVWSACEDDTLIVALFDFVKGNGVGEDFGVYVVVTHSAGNQLIVLTAEIKNENFFLSHKSPCGTAAYCCVTLPFFIF